MATVGHMTNIPPIVLLVEDEPQIRRFVRIALEAENWLVHEAETIAKALVETKLLSPDMIVLDLGLPDGDGLGFISNVRQWSAATIIVLSARSGESDKICALDVGADDYLTKPFGAGELLARVRAVQRRRQLLPIDEGQSMRFGNVSVNVAARSVTKAGKDVHLTPTEFQLLTVLLRSAGGIVSNAQLLRAVWGQASNENAHYLSVYMSRLRLKLETNPHQPQYFQTEAGVGYRLLLAS